MKKRIIGTILSLALVIGLIGCGKAGNTEASSVAVEESASEGETLSDAPEETIEESVEETAEESTEVTEPIYIVYTNDIHSYIYNTITDENNEKKPGLRMSNIAAMVSDMKADGKNVILVDAGDELQGDVYGAFDEGKSVVELMNACSYQLATPGNHDFDFGMGTFFNRIDEADYPYISCNFHALVGERNPLSANHIFDISGSKIAFIGITTPETITSSTPIYFQNEKGEYIYAIDGTVSPQELYDSVQKAIDEVRDEADYVIALAHVGVGLDEKRNNISSYDIIENTVGLDAYIDGHSHTLMEKDSVSDKNGNNVVLTQTGSYLTHIGVMEINDGIITTSLVENYDNADSKVAELEEAINARLMEQMGEKIATLDSTLYIYDPDKADRRIVREQETNLGDLTADAVYWYLNNRLQADCDIALSNGGGVRAQVEKGDVTYLDVKSIEPFGNMICLIEATGQQILDALEMGVTVVGEGDGPAENGGFMQVAGMQYTIDTTIPSSVRTTVDGMFVSVDGEYRVKDVKIYNKETGKYEDIDLSGKYTVSGIDYLLRNSGNGLNMFADDNMVMGFVEQDYVILSQYLTSFNMDGDYPRIKSENSPLYELNGYLLDYENPFGAGRINIIMN